MGVTIIAIWKSVLYVPSKCVRRLSTQGVEDKTRKRERKENEQPVNWRRARTGEKAVVGGLFTSAIDAWEWHKTIA